MVALCDERGTVVRDWFIVCRKCLRLGIDRRIRCICGVGIDRTEGTGGPWRIGMACVSGEEDLASFCKGDQEVESAELIRVSLLPTMGRLAGGGHIPSCWQINECIMSCIGQGFRSSTMCPVL